MTYRKVKRIERLDVILYQWSFIDLRDTKGLPAGVLLSIREVFADGFGLSELWREEDARHALSRSTILGLLQDDEGEIAGYAFYTVPDTPLEENYLLWEDAVCLRKKVQGQGYAGQNLFALATQQFKDRTFGWLGGRTQNPIVMQRYARLGSTFPFDILYDERPQLMDYLIEHVEEVRTARNQLDMRTGICRQMYQEGRLGEYPSPTPGTERFLSLLDSWNFMPEKGDAAIILTSLDEPFLAENFMVSKEAEYSSLREELISHQSRRESILSIGITAAVGLIVIGIDQSNPYTPLFALLVLIAVRIQITEIHAGIQRIATYLRVVHEGQNSDLHWETTSFSLRQADLKNPNSKRWVPKILPIFSSMEYFIALICIASWVIALSIGLAKPEPVWVIQVLSGLLWLAVWLIFGRMTKDLRTMTLEEKEENRIREILGLAKAEEELAVTEMKPKAE